MFVVVFSIIGLFGGGICLYVVVFSIIARKEAVPVGLFGGGIESISVAEK